MFGRSVPAVWLTMYALVAWPTFADSGGIHAVFKASDGDTIELDTRTGAFRAPRSPGAQLEDCSDAFQNCVTDHHGFAFSYFRDCKDILKGDRLKFPRQIVSVLHDHVWTVSDAAPHYLFHYESGKGVVGIILGPTPSFDFRSALRNPRFRLFDFETREYRIVGSNGILACKD